MGVLDGELPPGNAEPPGRAEDAVNVDPSSDCAFIAKHYTVRQSREPGLVISVREYERLIERLKGCKAHGWSDFWLTGVGLGGGLSATALVTVLVLPPAVPSTDKVILWMLLIIGSVIFGLCLTAYFTQRRPQSKEINELTKDLEMHNDKATIT